MKGLFGLDPHLVHLDDRSRTPTQQARVAALQSGALLFEHLHAKFDFSLTGRCAVCDVEDTHEHRVCHCPKYEEQRRPFAWVCELWHQLPPCLTHHLLPPANPHGPQLRAALHALPDTSAAYLSDPSQDGLQHLFTDGSGLHPTVAELSLCAWSVVNSSTGMLVSCGQLPGLQQTVPRAETFAVLSAVTWVRHHATRAAIWCDAKHVAERLLALLTGDAPEVGWSNYDLWPRIWQQLRDIPSGLLVIQHVPSHLDPSKCRSPFEEWIARWNQHADTVAGIVNLNRPTCFVGVHQQAVEHWLHYAGILRALRSIYDSIAELTHGHPRRALHSDDCELIEDLAPATLTREHDLQELLPPCWRELFPDTCLGLPCGFVIQVVQLLVDMDAHSEGTFRLSRLEILMIAIIDGRVDFPVVSSSGCWVDRDSVPFAGQSLTLGAKFSLFRRLLALLSTDFSLTIFV